jgi:hypothetical protein
MKLAGLLCIFALTLSAKEYAPLPKEIVSAKKVHLTDESGDLKLLDALYERIKKWRHWELVAEASQADIVIVLTGQQRNVGTFTTGQVSASGTFGSGYALGFPIIQHMRYLVFIEPTTKTTLLS